MATTVVLIGAGNRGMVYANYALEHPDRLKVTAVAEPNAVRRERAAAIHGIPPERRFSGWEELLAGPAMADGCIIATQDRMHVEPCLAAIKAGYHVLLEKPMALREEDCRRIVEAAAEADRSLEVCHVLRYTDFFRAVKSIISDGVLGEVYSVFHAENVSYHHMAHSYVRGNWGDSATASPMILAKCCHDMDLLYWLVGSAPVKIASVGNLSRFKLDKAPAGATARCTDGCAADCQYNAVDTYLHGRHMKLGLMDGGSWPVRLAMRALLGHPRLCALIPGLRKYVTWTEWPTSTIADDMSEAGIMKALREGPYGRCVYACDNDQVDHQETIVEFRSGATATLRMHGHSFREGRTLRIDGERGTLRGSFGAGGSLEVRLHGTGKTIRYPVTTDAFGHGEGDRGIMEHFVGVLDGRIAASGSSSAGGNQSTGGARSADGCTSAEAAFMSHRMAFAAHEARVGDKVVFL